MREAMRFAGGDGAIETVKTAILHARGHAMLRMDFLNPCNASG
jgi:hypothetical protein